MARLVDGVAPREFTGHMLDLPKGGANVRLGPQLERSPPRRCWPRCSAAARTSTSTAATRSRCAAGDAMAANRVTQMIDPWPPASGNRNIAYNGEKAAVAAERYRTGQVIPPVNATTSSAAYAQAQQQAQSTRQQPGARRRRRRQQQQSDQVAAAGQECRPMRMAKSSSAANKTVVAVLTADPAFEQSVRSTFGASGADRAARRRRHASRAWTTLRHRRRHRRHRRSRRRPSRARWQALERLMRRIGALAAGGGGDAELRRRGGAHACCRCGSRISWSSRCSRSSWCAPARASPRPDRRARPPRRRSTPSCPRSAAPASPRWRSRPRCCCSTAASAAGPSTCLVDLDFQHGACADYLDLEPRLDLERDRAAAGAARPAAARSHAVASRLRP